MDNNKINEVWEKTVIVQALLDEAHQKIRKEIGTYPCADSSLSNILERSGYRVRISVEKIPDNA